MKLFIQIPTKTILLFTRLLIKSSGYESPNVRCWICFIFDLSCFFNLEYTITPKQREENYPNLDPNED